ncbi:MAG: tetratricopeptide repeat protein [Candidatus Rifleibacteriota bacterium]
MINCPGCGAVNNEDSISCIACNRTLKVVCPQCSLRNPLTAAICSQCGRILNEKNDPRIMQQKIGDPVSDMYAEDDGITATDEFPLNSFLKVFIGGFVFALLYLSKILSGYPFALLGSGLLSGILALWGLIEIAFWLIEDNVINENPNKDKLPDNYPTKEEGGLPVIGESFEETDKELINKNKSSEKAPEQPSLSPAEEEALSDAVKADTQTASVKESEEDSTKEFSQASSESDKPSKPQYETLAEFLSDGIEKEIQAVQRKIRRSPENYALLMHLAQLHEERGELNLALEKMTECVSFEPEIAEIYLYFGVLNMKSDQIEEAREAFYKALDLNRFMSKAFYQLGILERGSGDLQKARKNLQKCIQLSPDDAYAHYQLGMVYREMGDSGLAMMELKRATILHPTDSYGHSKLGQIYQQNGQYDLSISEYSQALSLKPHDPFVLEKLAEVVAAKGLPARAAELFQEALAKQFHPKIETMISLGKMLRKLEEFEDLELLADEILRLSENNSDGLFLKAYAVLQQNREQEAIELFEKLSEYPHASYEAWLELGKLYQNEGREDKALSAFIRASTNAPDQAGIWNNIGILLGNQKAYEEALKAFKKAASFDYSDQQIADNLKAVEKKLESSCSRIIESRKAQLQKEPDDLNAYIEMGRAYEVLQRPDDALMAYQRLLAINPEHVDGLICYAELLRKRGKLKMAMRCYREILKLQPENARTHLYLVQANLNLGFLNEALRHAVTAQKLNQDDPRTHFLLGKIYFAKGLAPRALKEFTVVASTASDPDMISWAELMRRRLSRTV